MVTVFFAISGYVIGRTALRALYQRRLPAAYKSLASAVFRRIFRLYLPPTVSMLIVALLAQSGLPKTEDAIFRGPDSVYINSTVAVGTLSQPCSEGAYSVQNPVDLRAALGLESDQLLDLTGI